MQEGASTYTFNGLTIEVWPGVFSPNKTSELLIEAVSKHSLSGKSVIDMGCGSGVVGLMTAKATSPASLSGSDISETAIKNAVHNASLLGIKAEYKFGSLFEPWVDRKFDVILCDISALAEPIARLSPWYPKEIHCGAGLDGAEWTTRLLTTSSGYLNPNGRVFFATASLSDENRILEAARSAFASVECLIKRSWPFREDFWNKIMANETARKLIEKGIVRVLKKGSRWLWDTSIYVGSVKT